MKRAALALALILTATTARAVSPSIIKEMRWNSAYFAFLMIADPYHEDLWR